MPALILTNDALVLRAFAVLTNAAPSNTDLGIHKEYIKDFGATGYIAALNDIFAGVSDQAMASILLANTGLDTIDLEGDGNTDNSAIALAFIQGNAGNRVGAMLDLTKAMQGSALAPAASFNANFEAAYAYATNSVNVTPRAFDSTVDQILTAGMDSLTGGALNDFFKAYLVNGANTLQDGDVLNGGTGSNTLFADINASQQGFVITAETKNIENVLFRVQNNQTDTGDNNIAGVGIIDAERMKDVTNWENNNSRADLVIEDIRINDNQITKDITITMRETDPGHVDYGVYFDQNSLRNVKTSLSSISLEAMDTRAVVEGRSPLDKMVIEGFAFNAVYNNADGSSNSLFIELRSQAIQNAKTYTELRDALQAAADAKLGAGVVTFSIGGQFEATDTKTGIKVLGDSITMSVAGAFVFDVTNETNGVPGWIKVGTAPADSGEHTYFKDDGTNTSADLVTSTVVLDYVGRGSNGGDLVIGGLSVGDTSSSKGVQQFNITVEDDSRLQTINSTNNSLQEVYIKNGAQSRIGDAYNPVDSKGGLLSVLGNDGKLGNNDALGRLWVPAVERVSGVDSFSGDYKYEVVTPGYWSTPGSAAALPGTATQHDAYGFTDVRVIDGSAMTGKLTFDAEITEASKTKYLDQFKGSKVINDTGANPAADNVPFVYSGGSNNDTMLVDIDSAVASSVNTLTAREDFSFTLNGGAGNDALTVGIKAGTAANWYANQAQLNNITVNGGADNDTIKTTSAGDFVINAGADKDTVYIGNDGQKSVWVVSTGTAITKAGALDTTAEALAVDLKGVADNAAPVFLSDGKLTVIWSGAGATDQIIGGGVMGDSATGSMSDVGVKGYTNGLEVTVDIPTGEHYAVTQYHINQAIKNAINNDPVLSKLLKAYDGPTTSLIIESLVDGANVATDLQLTVWNNKTYAASDTSVLKEFKLFNQDSSLNEGGLNTAIADNVDAINERNGMSDDGTPGTTEFFAGSSSTLTTDNVIDMGSGQDVLVLSTSVAANEVVKFTAASGVNSTVVNFSTVALTDVLGGDRLDFTAYLTSKVSSSGSTESQERVATSLATGTANTTVAANSVTILAGLNFNTDATDTFAGLTKEKFEAAIKSTNSGTADYGDIANGTLDALDTYATSGNAGYLVNNLGKAVVMVENDDNLGEYKVFELTFKGITGTNDNNDFDTVTLIGTVDFGASLTVTTTPAFALANLV